MKNKIIKLLLQSIFLTAVSLSVFSQAGTSLIKVIVSPDHKDWTYKVNETAKFNVQVLQYGNLLENVTVDYEAGQEMLPDIQKEGVVLKTGKIQPTVKDPADFDTFWNNAIAEARKMNLDPKITLMPERCTSEANVYHISFQNDAWGSRIYGDPRTAALGFITLEIGIHGIPVNLDPQVYFDLNGGALAAYNNIRLNDRNTFYYKRVYLGCVRAVDFIFNLPEFNGTDIAVTGGSQGGALTIVTAGLDKRIKYLAPIYPALCDNTGYLNNRAGGWPHYFRNAEPKPGEVETLGYYDVVNFARRITVPGYYTWGYNDITCPPTSTYSAYNIVTAPKELHIFQETGHWTFPEQNEALNSWLVKQLKGQ